MPEPGDQGAPASPPTLLGRGAALATLHDAVLLTVAGRGGVVLISGEPGIGKTALAEAAASHARSVGASVLWGTGWEGGGVPGFWPWIQVLRAWADDRYEAPQHALGELARLVPELAGGGPTEAPGGEDAAARFRLFDAVWMVLRHRAAVTPVVVVLDDLHWADTGTLELFAFIGSLAHAHPVLLLGTYRDTEAGENAGMLRDILGRLAGDAEVLALRPLELDEVRDLMAHVGVDLAPPDGPDEDIVAVVVRSTGGNPFFVRQPARLLADGRPLPRAGTMPAAVRSVLDRRLARLPQPTATTLEPAAIVGPVFTTDLISEATGEERADVDSALHPAMAAGVVDVDGVADWRFTHDLFRQAVLDGVPPSERSVLHLRVAGALMRRAATGARVDAAEVARHLGEALPAGDPAEAVEWSRRAADAAAARLAHDEAADHLRQALRAHGLRGGPPDADLLLALGDAERRAGERSAVGTYEAAASIARQTGDRDELARAALGLHRVGAESGSSRRAVIALLEEAAIAIDPDSPAAAELAAATARELAGGPDQDVPRARSLAVEAVGAARRSGDPQLLATCLSAQHDVIWEPGTARQRLEIAADLAAAASAAGDAELGFDAAAARFTALLELADPGIGAALDRLASLAEELRQPACRWYVRTRRLAIRLLTGDLAGLHDAIDEAEAEGRRLGVPDAVGVAYTLRLGLIAATTGFATSERVWSDAATAPPEIAVAIDTIVALDRGEPVDSVRLRATLDQTSGYRWRLLTLWVLQAEVAVRARAPEACRRLHDLLSPFAGEMAVVGGGVAVLGSVSQALGELSAVLGRLDDAVMHFETASAVAHRVGARPLVAAAEAALSGVLGNESPDRAAVFRREGELWLLSFEDETVRLRDVKGLHDIAMLLGRPNDDVHSAELVGGEAPLESGLGADPVLDRAAAESYRRRLADIDAAIDEHEAAHDIGRLDALHTERDALLSELGRAAGLGGRARRLNDPAERARKTVTARIRDALDRIERQHPALGHHLRTSIHTGTSCSYRPARPIAWKL